MNPNQALERAVFAYLTSLETPMTLISNTSIYKGLDNPISVEDEENTVPRDRKVLPCVILAAEGNHEEVVFDTGNYRGILAVTVEANAMLTTDAEFNTLCEQVFSKFNIAEFETNLNSDASNFYLYQASGASFSDTVNNGGNWQKTLRLIVVYAQKDL